MILATVLIAVPVMGLLVAFDFWHCRGRKPYHDQPSRNLPSRGTRT